MSRFTVEYDYLTINPATRGETLTHHVLTIGDERQAHSAVENLKLNRRVSNVVMHENVEGMLNV